MANDRMSGDAVAQRAASRVEKKRIAKMKPEEGDRRDLRTHPARPVKSVGNIDFPELPHSEVDMPPEEVARRAYNHGALLDPATRQTALDALTSTTSLADTDTGRALAQVLENADRAVDILSLIGYVQLRHLRANGLSMAKIAKDLGINLNDLTAYMSQAPTANEDALIDEEAFADVKASELMEELEHAKPKNSLETEVLKIKMNFLLEYNKRMSHRWAQKPDEEIMGRLPTLNINLGIVAPTPRMIAENAGQPASTKAAPPPTSLEETQDGDYRPYNDDSTLSVAQLDDDLPVVKPVIQVPQDD